MLDLRELSGYINKQLCSLSVGVVGVIITGGKVLMVHNSQTDFWSFPGGHLRENESIIDGVKREVREETGKEFNIEQGPAFYQYKLPNGLELMLFFYAGSLKHDDGKYTSGTAEVKDIKRFGLEALPEKIYENTRIIIQHFQATRAGDQKLPHPES